MTGRNLLSPVLAAAAVDVESFDTKVTAANERAAASADTSSKAQTTAADRVVAANTRAATSSADASAKITASNVRASESSRAFADVTESTAARSGVAWASLATKGIPLAGAAIALVTGKMAADYQTLVVKLQTTAGESAKNIGMVSQGMLDMAGKVGLSADELAKGMYTIESAGYHGSAGLKVLQASAEGARQENADLAKVTDAVSTALHDYHLPASDAAKVTSELITAVSHGKTTFDELTGSLHSVTPLAAKLHVSLADVTGTLSAMTASGESADQATQNMADTLRHLANPTATMTSELAQLGITSSDLSNDLSSKGLAGTLQLVETAIVNHLDPATQKVLLPALNQSKTAVADLNQMMANMPPALAKASQSLLDGKTSIKDYQTAAKDMGGQQGAMALQFLSLMKSSDGFNQVLKQGGPAAQAFTAAMAKSFGTASALNVALQTTGENAGATNKAIADVARASAQADGNIKGWSEVQGTFNQQLHETGAELGAMAISAGQHLLPAMSSTVGVINRDVLPGLKSVGSGVGDAVHWFMQLPAPVKDATLALVALKVITSTDMFAGMLASGRVLAVGFANDMSNMVTAARAGAGQITAAFAEAKAARQALTAEKFSMDMSMLPKATGDIAGLGAAAGAAAKGGLAALGKGLMGVVNLVGGPWVVGIAAAVAGLSYLDSQVRQHDEEVKRATQDVTAWNKAITLGGGTGPDVTSAVQKLDALKSKIADIRTQMDALSGAGATPGGGSGRFGATSGAGSALEALKAKYAELTGELDRGTKAWQAQESAMTPVQLAQAKVATAQDELNQAIRTYGNGSQQAMDASGRYQQALVGEMIATDQTNRSERTHLQNLQDIASQQLTTAQSTVAIALAQDGFQSALDQLNTDMKTGQVSAAQLKTEQDGVASAALSWASSAGQAAAAQAKANGVTDTGNASNAAQLQVLQQVAQQMGDKTPAAIVLAIAALQNATFNTDDLKGSIAKMGLTTESTWKNNSAIVKGATDAQIADLEGLGYKVTHLPNGYIEVDANTQPAKDALNSLEVQFNGKTITFNIAAAANGAPIGGAGGPNGHIQAVPRAAGGPITGPGSGTSDSVLVAASNGEHMWTAREVNAAGGHAGVEALRSAVLASGQGYATGGRIGPINLNAVVNPASAAAFQSSVMAYGQSLANQAFAVANAGATGVPASRAANEAIVQAVAAGYGWGSGAQWNDLVAVIMRESGFNNVAQNPTSTAYGMFQFLNSTWAGYPYGKTSDSHAQAVDGLMYIRNRYGSPAGAYAHEQSFGWYGNGGIVTSPQLIGVGEAGPEAIIPLTKPAQAAQVMSAAGLTPAASPGYGAATAGRPIGPMQISVSIDGAAITGRLEMGTDGMVTLVDGRIDHVIGRIADTVHYATGG